MTDTKPEYYSYADMDGITTRNVIPKQSAAEPWRLSEEARRQLAEIEHATVRAGDPRMNTIVGPRPDTQVMTDEEHENLCAWLRWTAFHSGPEYSTCDLAADEIERLAAENKKLRNKLLEYVAESNTEFFFDSFPEKRTDWMKDD